MLFYMLRTKHVWQWHTQDWTKRQGLCTWCSKSRRLCHCCVVLPMINKMAMLLQTLSGEERPSTLQGRQWRNLSLIHPWEQPDAPRAARTAGEEEEGPQSILQRQWLLPWQQQLCARGGDRHQLWLGDCFFSYFQQNCSVLCCWVWRTKGRMPLCQQCHPSSSSPRTAGTCRPLWAQGTPSPL